ncbi:MAG TPA: metallophosphoesterase [Syntrophobacteraceae bacterium]|nr:metallophosphoesterase [Syntrophobacteraceae bacterium]
MVETDRTPSKPYQGVLFIGDPHLAAFPPGHRLDDYPQTVLGKLAYCLEAAGRHRCLPVILGDLFHVPRNNPNSLLVDLIELFRGSRPWVLVGNHDKHEARLTRDVSLSVLEAAGVIRLLKESGPADSVLLGGARVLIGASPDWTPLPKEVEPRDHDRVLWLTHHDLALPGYDGGRFALKEIPGVDLVVNGHIHTPKPPQQQGRTTWLNPGSIVRITRSLHTLRIRPAATLWFPARDELQTLEIPHRPFDEVFPPWGEEQEANAPCPDESLFIKGLENLTLRKTTEGVGLQTFLEANLRKDDPIDTIIWELYEEVIPHEAD